MKIFRTTVLLLLLTICCGFRGLWPRADGGGNPGVSLEKMARDNGWEWRPAGGKKLELSGCGWTVRMNHNSRSVTVNEVRLQLKKPVVRRTDGEWVLSAEDAAESLAPFFSADTVPDSPVRRIVIDAGHGGTDPGAQSGGLQEKNVNLDLAKRIAKILEAEKMEVVMTRSTDVFLPLVSRADEVRTENADLFLSIHQNSAKNRNAGGLECFFSLNNRYAGASLRLAWEVQSALLAEFNASGTPFDRGIKQADFRVIRSADCPAVLLECGFISNAGDRQRMTQENYLDEFAQAVAEGILNYCRIRETPQEEDQK